MCPLWIHFVLLFIHFHWSCWKCGCWHGFIVGLRVPPCGQIHEHLLLIECTNCLVYVEHMTSVLTSLFKKLMQNSPSLDAHWWDSDVCIVTVTFKISTNRDARVIDEGALYWRLLSRMALQSSDQDRRRLWEEPTGRCLLWQAVNRMCSHVGLGSTPNQDTC